MDKNTNIIKYFLYGVFCIFLLNFVSGTLCFGVSISDNEIVEEISLITSDNLSISAADLEFPLGKQPYESEETQNEEDIEEESKDIPFLNLVSNTSSLPLQQFISSEYQDFHLSTIQQKRYLLFHHLKIYC